MSERPPAVHVEDVAKSFSIPRERVHTLKERVLHPLRRAAHDEFEALRGVRASGRSIVFISHFLDDVLEVSDTVTVFRNGRRVATSSIVVLRPPCTSARSQQARCSNRLCT